MRIRNAIVNGVRVFALCDIAGLIGVHTQSLTFSANQSMTFYFKGPREDGGKASHLVGMPYCEVCRILEKRLRRNRIGSDIVPSILEWMSLQQDLEVPDKEVEAAQDFEKMTPKEIYEAGRLDEFLKFVETRQQKAAERNNAIRLINQAKIELNRLRDESGQDH